jgi:hypothetical protein
LPGAADGGAADGAANGGAAADGGSSSGANSGGANRAGADDGASGPASNDLPAGLTTPSGGRGRLLGRKGKKK